MILQTERLLLRPWSEADAESIYEYFADEANKDIIERLKAAGLQFEMTKTEEKLSNELEGKIIVISGNFSISRDEMKAIIAAHGGKNSGSVSGKTSYLLAGEKAGPEKLKKAESLGVTIIDEAEFMTMIDSVTIPEGNTNDKTTQNTGQVEPFNGEQLSLF